MSFASTGAANTLRSCKEASSEFVLGVCSVPPGHAFVTVAVSEGEGLNWCGAIKVGSNMVVALSFKVFTHDELLARCLASCASLGMAAPVSRSESVMS